jgi:16S rRNA C967 or C1407 C5-methylase (RsmB/RsmF family)
MKTKKNAAELFDSYYGALFGERWPLLKKALLAEQEQTALDDFLKRPYYLDRASVWAAEALEVEEGMRVLDMCAAPGGKTLVLAKALKGKGLLTVNDRSDKRFFRLKRTTELLCPPYDAVIKMTRIDASRYSLVTGVTADFDRILLDAPCSSEEHVLKNNYYLDQWSPGRIKRLAVQQTAMLCQALELCRSGGRIVYSTCALTPDENDDVIAKILKKRAGLFKIIENTCKHGEKTRYGCHILPDRAAAGPLYYAILEKI